MHQTMLDLVIAHPNTISKHVSNMQVVDLPSEPSDHKLVTFNIRVDGFLHPASSPSQDVQLNRSEASLDHSNQVTKLNYKKLRDTNIADKLKIDLQLATAAWEPTHQATSMSVAEMDSSLNADFQCLSDCMVMAAESNVGRLKKDPAAREKGGNATLPPNIQAQVTRLSNKVASTKA